MCGGVVRGKNKVYCDNWLNNNLPDKCASLIIADPPYYKVKGEFDFIWKTFDDYLADVEKWAIECKRVLADNGTLFWWGNSKKIAYSQIILDKYFNLENSMMWRKIDSMQYQYYSVELSRTFNTHNERVLMYSNDYEPNDWNKTGLERVMEEHIKPRHPFALYLKSEFKRAKVTNKEIAKLFPSKTGGLTGCVSNWLNGDNTPTKEQYLKIREYLNNEYLRQEYEYLRQEYEELRQEYEELRQEYEELRRYFNNTMKLEEVLEFSQESNISKDYDHDTVKPEKLTRALILTCSRPNDLVVVPFAGSGTECAMSAKEGRQFIGFDIEQKHVDTSNKRCQLILNEPQLNF
jgi:site-specific DNA-methyltransferase (adenine-specific)